MLTITEEERNYIKFVQYWLALEAKIYTITLS